MNKGKVKIKTIIIMAIMLLTGVMGILGINTVRTYLSGAAGGAEPKNVLAKPGEDGRSAQVSWLTDKAIMAIVEYGTTPASLLLRATETEATKEHKVNLSPLKANTSYYFRIKVKEGESEIVYDNNGIPFSFKTKGIETSGGEVMPTIALPSKIPTLPITSPIVPGPCKRDYDYSGDGKVNSLDYIECMKKQRGTTTTPASGSSSSKCQPGVDYDGNGTVNALDMIKCLQGT